MAIPGFGITLEGSNDGILVAARGRGWQCLICSAPSSHPFLGAVKETKNKSKRRTSQHLGKLEKGFVLKDSGRKTLTCPGHGWATKSMAGRELGMGQVLRKRRIFLSCAIPCLKSLTPPEMGWEMQVALGSAGVWMRLSQVNSLNLGRMLHGLEVPASVIFSMDASWNQAGCSRSPRHRFFP